MTIDSTAQPRLDVKMSPRDLINIGIFAALYLATVGVLNALEFIGPLATLVSIVVSIIAGGVPFMLFLTRVKHAGMVTVFAVIVNAFMLLIGSPAIALVLGVLLALVAEALLWLGRYRSRKLSVVAYAVFSMWFAGLFLPMFYAREDYLSGEYMQSMGQEYRDALDAFLSPGVLAAFDLSTFLFGLIGGVLGLRLLDKHFRKAGIA